MAELALEETTTPKKQVKLLGAHLMSGQPETVTSAAYMTPINIPAGTKGAYASEVGSVFIDGKRRSARTNFSYSADGNSVANELVMNKVKKCATARNLDSPVADMLKSPRVASPGALSQNSAVKLPMDACVANLNSIGIYLGSSIKAINVSYNAIVVMFFCGFLSL